MVIKRKLPLLSKQFEQTILLVGQVFNSVAYQRYINVLNLLKDNNVKVKEALKEPMLILKEPMSNLDAIDIMIICLEKSLKKNSQKLQVLSKNPSQYSLGFKKKSNMMNQFVNPVNRPFWPGPLPNSQQRGRGQSFLFARGRRSKQLLSMLVSSAESENTQPTKSSSHTSSELNFNESGGNYNSAN